MTHQKRLFFCIAIFGTLVRAFVAWSFHTRAWIDEIWVVLQPAYHLLTGVGPMERDWAWQVRDWIPPLFFAGLMKTFAFADGEAAHRTLRLIVSLATSASIVFFSIFLRRHFRMRDWAWLTLLVLFFVPDFIHYSATFDLSVLGLPVLLFGISLLYWHELKKPTLTFQMGAALIALSALIRFQFGVFAFVFLLGFALKKQWRKFSEMALIGIAALVFDFMLNSRMYGNAVLPIFNYFMVNTTGGVAASYGVTPFYFAFELMWKFMTEAVFLLVVFFTFPAFRKAPVLVAAVVLFFVIHMLVGHKEYRFFYGAAFMAAAVSTSAFEQWCEKRPRKFLFGFLILFLSAASFRATQKIDWHAYEVPMKLEMGAGQDLRTTGLLTVGWGGIYQGCNFAYYRPLPCFFFENIEQLRASKADFSNISHLVVPTSMATPCKELLKEERGGRLYRCSKYELAQLVSGRF